VRDPVSLPPTFIGDPMYDTWFCDWTEKGDVLVNISIATNNSQLAVYDRRGRLLRITEDIAGRHNSIIIPATGLHEFKKVLEEMIKASEEIPQANTPPAA